MKEALAALAAKVPPSKPLPIPGGAEDRKLTARATPTPEQSAQYAEHCASNCDARGNLTPEAILAMGTVKEILAKEPEAEKPAPARFTAVTRKHKARKKATKCKCLTPSAYAWEVLVSVHCGRARKPLLPEFRPRRNTAAVHCCWRSPKRHPRQLLRQPGLAGTISM
jgi:hypothetical protein